ncbi:MAG TPA: hypothetical protein VGQ81_09045 [Acidobacteriota bacterium]|nr:hypothetical protein [Acidobacteriota bacterium]
MSKSTLAVILLSSLLAPTLSGCQKTETPQAQPTTTAQPAQSSTAPVAAPAGIPASAPATLPAPGKVIASAQYSADPDLRCDLLEVKRVSGGALLIRWRLVNTVGAQQTGLAATQPKSISYDFGWGDIYYIDPAENKKYGFLTDSEGNRILDIFWGSLAAGQQRVNWAKFPAPPPSSNKISVNVPKFPPFEDVPVS